MKYRNPTIPEGINTSETNPLKEFILLSAAVVTVILMVTLLLVFLIDRAAKFVPFEYEVSIAQSISEKVKDEPNEVDVYLQHLADKVTSTMNLPEDMKVTVHYVNEDVVNAIATLGGHIFVYRGMLEKLPHENALFMLLGHEIAHIKYRHPLKALGKGVVISLLFSSLMGQSSDAVEGAVSGVTLLALLDFSREQEAFADKQGLQAVYKHYAHVQGASDLFEVLNKEQQSTGTDTLEFLSSHPDVLSRIKALSAEALDANWRQQGKLTLLPESILQRLQSDKESKSKSLDN